MFAIVARGIPSSFEGGFGNDNGISDLAASRSWLVALKFDANVGVALIGCTLGVDCAVASAVLAGVGRFAGRVSTSAFAVALIPCFLVESEKENVLMLNFGDTMFASLRRY
jgi:hypothetical protein